MKEGEASEERTSAFKTQQQGGPGLKVGGARETSHSPLLYQLEKATASSSLCDSLFFPFALFSPKLGRRSVKEKGDGLKRDDKWQPPSLPPFFLAAVTLLLSPAVRPGGRPWGGHLYFAGVLNHPCHRKLGLRFSSSQSRPRDLQTVRLCLFFLTGSSKSYLGEH